MEVQRNGAKKSKLPENRKLSEQRKDFEISGCAVYLRRAMTKGSVRRRPAAVKVRQQRQVLHEEEGHEASPVGHNMLDSSDSESDGPISKYAMDDSASDSDEDEEEHHTTASRTAEPTATAGDKRGALVQSGVDTAGSLLHGVLWAHQCLAVNLLCPAAMVCKCGWRGQLPHMWMPESFARRLCWVVHCPRYR